MELKGKTVLITGSTDGLGQMVATHLAQRGAMVILHGRNEEKGRAVLEEIRNETANSQLEYYNGDFASLHNVRLLGENILKKHNHIDILINNAGVGIRNDKPRELSKDGFELRFAVNYLAQVLLTETLLPAIDAGNSHIINVASAGQAPLDFSNLMLEKEYESFAAYRQSKTALIMYTFDLAERLKEKGVKVNAVHPASMMDTKMVREGWGHVQSSVDEGAESVENLLDTDVTGEYFDQKKIAKAIPQAYHKQARATLKEITEGLLEKFSPVMAH